MWGAGDDLQKALENLCAAINPYLKTQSENDKDWSNPVFRSIYQVLAVLDSQSEDGQVYRWLNANGFCNVTVCPECSVDDFTHFQGCALGESIRLSSESVRLQRQTKVT
jgi:hypothetical protein